MPRTALITGVAGQDGRHLAELLLGKGYKVYGMMRGQMEASHPRYREIREELPGLEVVMADLLDIGALASSIQQIRPDEVYNLAAISHVGYSFRNPVLTADVTGVGVLNVLEAIRLAGLMDTTRFYQASTSEMFGGQEYNRASHGYDEHAIFHPRSPYGVAKLYGHWITKNYRESYSMHASCGILFNHEGERRGPEFVTRKISQAVASIRWNKLQRIDLGNLDARRDWGYAGDYVEGMWRILQQQVADDYVLSSGETHSIREFCDLAFREIGIDLTWKGTGSDEVGIDASTGVVRVGVNPDFFRPAEVDVLLGDPRKAERVLGWKRRVDFHGLVRLMVAHDITEQAPVESA